MSYGVTRSAWVVVAVGLLVSACGAERPNVGPDKEPPELAIVSDVPLYTRAQSVSLNVKANDVTGVKHVWYAVNNGSPIEARTDAPQQEGALSVVAGTCEAGLTANTPNVVAIWAEDYAGNSGVSGQPPYMQVRTIIQSDRALAVSLNGAAQATYYDESKMTVGTEEVYNRNGARLEVIAPDETIHKAATRLAARPPLTTSPADLEGSNPDNLPWLQFKVSLTGSPLAAATYTIKAKVGSTMREYSGGLLPEWLSPQSSAGAMSGDVYFDLPLDSVRIPMLMAAVGTVTLEVGVHVTDAAGNEGGIEVPLKYAVIGPPLNIVIDSEYPRAGAPKSTHPYLIANGTGPYGYGTLFNASDVTTFGPEQQIRLMRLVITNPAPQPVALDVSSIAGSWKMNETWTGNQSGVIGSATFNGQTCPGNRRDAAEHIEMYAPLGDPDESARSPDPEVASAGWSGVAATSDLSSVVELRNGSAAQRVGTRYIVPAADGSAPGVLSLYVTRPLAVSRAGAPALDHHDQNVPYTNNVGTRYTYANDTPSPVCCAQGYRTSSYFKYHIEWGGGLIERDLCSMVPPDLAGASFVAYLGTGTYCQPGPVACPLKDGWGGTNIGPGTSCTNCTNTQVCACTQWAPAQVYNKYRYYRQLSAGAATETVAGSFSPITQPADDAGALYGVTNTGATSIPIGNGDGFTH
jgi:hypothetical protein